MTTLSRRAFARGLPLGLVGGGLLPLLIPAGSAAAPAPTTVTPLAQIRIGRFTVTALTDGHADMPYGFFPGRTPPRSNRRPPRSSSRAPAASASSSTNI